MTPETPPPQERYPFWGYLDLAAFIGIAIIALLFESVALRLFVPPKHDPSIYVVLPLQLALYAFLMGALVLIFRRYYGRPFWQSIAWLPSSVSAGSAVGYGIAAAFAVMVGNLVLRTPDIDSPMKTLLSDPKAVILIALLGTTIGPLFEEIVFRGFLQPLTVRSLGAAAGVIAAAVPFGLMHLQEYGYSWRHALLISLAGAAFGWMRQRTGSLKPAVVMHITYNCVFFVLLAAQQIAMHGRWAGYGR